MRATCPSINLVGEREEKASIEKKAKYPSYFEPWKTFRFIDDGCSRKSREKPSLKYRRTKMSILPSPPLDSTGVEIASYRYRDPAEDDFSLKNRKNWTGWKFNIAASNNTVVTVFLPDPCFPLWPQFREYETRKLG